MFKGTNASAGIGIGKAAVIKEVEMVIRSEKVASVEAEVQRFRGALADTVAQTKALADDLATKVGEKEAEIMNGHLMLLADPMMTGEIEEAIKRDSVCSEYAIETTCTTYADLFASMDDELMFASMDDELMQQIATDMRDIKTRMQQVLQGIKPVDIASLPEGSIIVAKDLTPSMTAGINPANVTGIVTELGGKTSHSAILARALEIPAVVAVSGILDQIEDGVSLVLDGDEGIVIVNPDQEQSQEYEKKRETFLKEKKELEKEERENALQALEGAKTQEALLQAGIPQDKVYGIGEELLLADGSCGYTVTGWQYLDGIAGFDEDKFFDYTRFDGWLKEDKTLKPYRRRRFDKDGKILEEELTEQRILQVDVKVHGYQTEDGIDTALDFTLEYVEETGDGAYTWRNDFYGPAPEEGYDLQMDSSAVYLDSPVYTEGESRSSFFFRSLEKGEDFSYTLLFVVDRDRESGFLLYPTGKNNSRWQVETETVKEIRDGLDGYIRLE